MGSLDNPLFLSSPAYLLGLWGADGYHRSSSIGITTVYPELAQRFHKFLISNFPLSRIRLRIYIKSGISPSLPSSMNWYQGKTLFCQGDKLRLRAYLPYVNSRPLLRAFRQALANRASLPTDLIPEYFAGRFDGDGSVAADHRTDFRITYSSQKDALIDRRLLSKIGPRKSKVYQYRSAGTHVLYVSRYESSALCDRLKPHSAKLSGLLITP